MTHFLDALPFDWSRSESTQLRDVLASAYYREEEVVRLAQESGISPASLTLGRPMLQVWHDLLEEARNQDKLRALVESVVTGPDPKVAAQVAELVGREPGRT